MKPTWIKIAETSLMCIGAGTLGILFVLYLFWRW